MSAEFSARDSLRALCLPLTWCLPTCSLAATSDDALHAGDDERAWFDQSRPTGHDPGTPSHRAFNAWDDVDEQVTRREADLLSLHERARPETSRWPARRRARRGGDVSGSGADPGSGLSRWTLLKSWWTLPRTGAIRLPDSDEEPGGNEDEPHQGNTTLQEGEGEADAVVLSQDQLLRPPTEPPLSPTRSERTEADDMDDSERQLRRARRRAKRRARELGVSLEEYEAGATAEPTELASPPRLDVNSGPRRPRSHRSSSSTDSRDKDSSTRYETESNDSRSRRTRRERQALVSIDEIVTPAAYRDSVAQRQYERGHGPQDPDMIPLPVSPLSSATDQFGPVLTDSKRPRHRSNPSFSTDSTASTSRRRPKQRRRKGRRGEPDGELDERYHGHEEGLDAQGRKGHLTADGFDIAGLAEQPSYHHEGQMYQDEYGQVRQYGAHEDRFDYLGEAQAQNGSYDARDEQRDASNYDNIGRLPLLQ